MLKGKLANDKKKFRQSWKICNENVIIQKCIFTFFFLQLSSFFYLQARDSSLAHKIVVPSLAFMASRHFRPFMGLRQTKKLERFNQSIFGFNSIFINTDYITQERLYSLTCRVIHHINTYALLLCILVRNQVCLQPW